jgi:hypothetical protein
MVVEMALCIFICTVIPILWDWRKSPDKTGQGEQAPSDSTGQGNQVPTDKTRRGGSGKNGQGEQAPSDKSRQGQMAPSRSKGKACIEVEDWNSVSFIIDIIIFYIILYMYVSSTDHTRRRARRCRFDTYCSWAPSRQSK